jgi:hypothetical protein
MGRPVTVAVISHKPYRMPQDPMYLPLHVGAALHPDVLPDWAQDNTGDNISERNAKYSELTGLYWLWKNDDSDYQGIVHYRRHFGTANRSAKSATGTASRDRFQRIVSEQELSQLLEGCDIVLPRKRDYYIETIYSHYAHTFPGEQLDTTCAIIAEQHPEYLPAFWVNNNITFPEGLLYEDIRTTYRLLLGAQKVIFLNEQLYLYRQRKNSIIHGAEAHAIEESRAAILDRNVFLHNEFPEFDKICDANIYKWHYGILMNPDYALSNDSEVRYLIKRANAYIRKAKKPKYLNRMLNWEQKVCLFIIQRGGYGLLIVLVSFLKRLRTTINRIVIN